MASKSWAKGLRLQSSQCHPVCLRRTVATPLSLQRRLLKTFHGPKYTAKIHLAELNWEDRAERIKVGTEQNLWDFFEERGFVKDVAG